MPGTWSADADVEDDTDVEDDADVDDGADSDADDDVGGDDVSSINSNNDELGAGEVDVTSIK